MRKLTILSLLLLVTGWSVFGAAPATACYDIRCEWIDQCYNEPGGWNTTYRSKVCLTNCGYWYDTGEKCCYTTQPGSC